MERNIKTTPKIKHEGRARLKVQDEKHERQKKDYVKLDLTDAECHFVSFLIVIYEITKLFVKKI